MKYFEDFKPGRVETIGHHSISEEEIIDFAAKWDPQAMHTNKEAASDTLFGGLIASGTHLFSLCVLKLTSQNPRVAVIAAIGVDGMRFREPVRPSDTLTITSECIEKRSSKTKKDRGVVQNRIRLTNQDGKVVFEYTDIILVLKKPESSPNQ
jgi:acyl dehydratase